jgi:hypothetical protein
LNACQRHDTISVECFCARIVVRRTARITLTGRWWRQCARQTGHARKTCYLGELSSSAQSRWLRTIEVFNEQGDSPQLKLIPSDVAAPVDDPQVARVLLNKVRLERTRQFGSCFMGWELGKRLELDCFFEQALDQEEADVPSSHLKERYGALFGFKVFCRRSR